MRNINLNFKPKCYNDFIPESKKLIDLIPTYETTEIHHNGRNIFIIN